MSTSKFPVKISPTLLSGLLAIVVIFAAGFIAVAMEKPTGAIAGRISLEQAGFGLQSYDIRKNKVYALAVGPRGGNVIERGVWINPDGTFRIDQLPVGEYSLRIRATGFSTNERQGVFVDEARVNRLPQELALSILEPSVNIAVSSRVFTTRETPRFWLNATGSTEAEVKIYNKDILRLLAQAGERNSLEFSSDLNLYKPYRAERGKLFAGDKPVQTLTRKLVQDQEDWARADFKLNGPLPAGEYVAVAEVANIKEQKDWNLMWFSVSDLGLILKQAPDKTLVRAIDLNTLRPLSNADIRLTDRTQPLSNGFANGKTGADGFVEFRLPASRRSGGYNLLAMGSAGFNRAFSGIDYWNDSGQGYRTYFYTERPVYRLGQTVFYKAMIRKEEQAGLVNPKAGLKVHATIEDPDNNKLWEGHMATNAFGTLNGAWQVPDDGKTGAYQLTLAYPDGTESYQRFEVAQYRKPEYQVDVLSLDKRVTAGGKARARIRATYYFGAPVTNARVKYSIYAASDWSGRYRLMPRPAHYGYYDDWADDEEEGADYYEDHSYAGDFITEGYTTTDDAGEAVVEFDTRAQALPSDSPYTGDYGDKRYTVQAEVTDLSRIAVIGSGTQSVTAGSFAVFIRPDAEVSRAGEPVGATVTAIDYEGKPVSNQSVEVALVRWAFDQIKGEYRGMETLKTVSVTTDAKGQARLALPTTDKFFTDGYYLTARTADSQGHVIYDQDSIWIASDSNPYLRFGEAAQQQAFAVRPDKPVYQPGETAKVMITAPVTGKEGAQAIVAIEGPKLYEYRVIPMDATAKLVEIPISDQYAPNVYVTATLVGTKHQYYHQEKMLKVSPEAHFLNIDIATDKPKYKPGETAVYTLKATDAQGKPAANTELSLGVVDESIYAIRPEAAADIRKFFYNKRYNAVMTVSSFPEEYSGGPDKIEPRVRQDFRDVAAWMPTLVTDANGLVRAKVKLPDNLTTWRATVRGINSRSDVGSMVSKVLSTQDLIVRLALPRFFTQHDQGNLTAIVHNYTERDQNVTLTLSASPQFETREALTRQLTVHPDHAERYSWPVDVKTPGEGVVAVKAIGQTDGDAMESRIPVRPLGVEMAVSTGGVLTADTATVRIPLSVPKNVPPELAKLLFSVAPSAIGPVLGNFDALIDYPYGCTEQTMSRLFPAVIAARLNRTLGVPLNGAQQQRFQAVSLKALARLKESRNGDGGWGWWRYDRSSPYLSAYVMEGLFLLREAGYPLADMPEGWEQDGLVFLEKSSGELARQLSDPKLATQREGQIDPLIDLAAMQYVLGLYDRKPSKPVRSALLGSQDWAPPEALAYEVLAFKQAGDTPAALTSIQALNRLADPASGLLNWDHTPRLRKLLDLRWTDYTYRFTGTEATALGLRATAAMADLEKNPAAAGRLEAIERWLLLQRNRDGWDNTKTTAQVLRAMMEKALALGKPGSTDMNVISNLWRESLHLGADDLYRPENLIRTLLSTVPGSAVTLEKQGMGRLYYNSLLSYMLPLTPGQSFNQAALPTGLQVRREFYRIQTEPVGPEGTLRFKTHAIPDHQVRAGETVLMKVVVDTPVALPYVIVDAALPSGAEVVSDDPRESNLAGGDDTEAMGGDWGSFWWAHQDILDDRVVMFSTTVPAGKSEFHALVRLELPGTFQMNPVKLEGMYSKAVRAYSPLDQIRVTE